ncbi:MAG: hypothetical protein ACT4PS_12740 [Betaproteobacteria bacterium]
MRSILILSVAAVSFLFSTNGTAHSGQEGLGTVHFPVSCTAEAQTRFNTAAAALYSFHWQRVEQALNHVLEADPGCAMVYWATAIARMDNPLGARPSKKNEKEGWAAIEKAKSLAPKTQRERDYIDAAEAFYRDHEKVPYETRAAAYEKAMEQLHGRYPEDQEGAVLYAFWLQVTADRNDKTYTKQLRSAEILEALFAAQPDHPGTAHFLIHAYDFPPIAARGLNAARRYAKIAPASPHALHMPSHIFSRAGYWQESIDTNTKARAASRLDRDVYHSLDYMAYAALQLGRDEEAKRYLNYALNNPKPNEQVRQVAYASAAMPARYALERGDWASAARIALHPARESFAWNNFPEAEAVNAFARGVGAARSGNAEAARSELGRFDALREAMIAQKKDYWITQLDIQTRAVSAWIARAEGRDQEAVQGLRAAADLEDRTEKHIMMPGPIIPVREMLGELLVDLGQASVALAQFEQSHKADPNRFRSMYGMARAAELAGNRDKAREYYAQLIRQCGDAAASRSEMRRAKQFVATR